MNTITVDELEKRLAELKAIGRITGDTRIYVPHIDGNGLESVYGLDVDEDRDLNILIA